MPINDKYRLILASSSPRRLELLDKIGIIPDQVIPANIDETVAPKEKPKDLAVRLAQEKAQAIAISNPESYVLAADTVVGCGLRILDKTEKREEAKASLTLLSGRRHRVYGGLCLITPAGKILTRCSETILKFKRLTDQQIDSYLDRNEWQGKAGGYAIQDYAESFIQYLSGSYSNVVGLSLYDTMNILKSGGYVTAPPGHKSKQD